MANRVVVVGGRLRHDEEKEVLEKRLEGCNGSQHRRGGAGGGRRRAAATAADHGITSIACRAGIAKASAKENPAWRVTIKIANLAGKKREKEKKKKNHIQNMRIRKRQCRQRRQCVCSAQHARCQKQLTCRETLSVVGV